MQFCTVQPVRTAPHSTLGSRCSSFHSAAVCVRFFFSFPPCFPDFSFKITVELKEMLFHPDEMFGSDCRAHAHAAPSLTAGVEQDVAVSLHPSRLHGHPCASSAVLGQQQASIPVMWVLQRLWMVAASFAPCTDRTGSGCFEACVIAAKLLGEAEQSARWLSQAEHLLSLRPP